jgi:sugar phosphate isomerase/epimerase
MKLANLVSLAGAAALLAGPVRAAQFRLEDTSPTSIKLWEGDQPVLVYNRFRASYIHPLYDVAGNVLTDDFPADHYHHRGLFWGWPHIIAGAEHFDLWMLKGAQVQFEKWLGNSATAEYGQLHVQNAWVAGGRKIMRETARIRAHPAGPQGRYLDLDLTWTPLEDLMLAGAEDKSYGGLTLRFAPRTNTVITTPQGVTPEDQPMTRMAWSDLTAQFQPGAAPAGASIFIHPSHADFPPMWLTRHYGVLCLGWPGVVPRLFPKDVPVHCQYRVWVHAGQPSVQDIDQQYALYATEKPARTPCNALFALDNGVGRGSLKPAEQARLLKELGYSGISYNETVEITNRLAAVQAEGLKLHALYVQGYFDQPARYEAGLSNAVKHLKGTDAFIWLTLRGAAGQNDRKAADLAQEVADLAGAQGLRVAIYPHRGFYAATAEDALRLVKLANRPNLGLTINLAHEVSAGNGNRLPEITRKVSSKLFLVTVNGAEQATADRDAIKVLGEGSLDPLPFLRELDELGYAGPIGLQGYGIPGEPKENLSRSMKTYQALCAQRQAARPTK